MLMKKTLLCLFALSALAGAYAQQPVVAVAPFEAISGVSTTDANMITRVFFIRLGNTNTVSLVDRTVVERVLKEHSFQAGDWSNQQKTAELGSALNADWIVRGELEKFGSNILVTVQFYDIQTFRFMGGADTLIANVDEAYDKMDPLVNSLVETITGAGSKQPGAAAQQPAAQSPSAAQPPAGGGSPSAAGLPNGLNYTSGRKVGAGFLNLAAGVGSFTMGDWIGGLIVGGTQIVGSIMMIAGWDEVDDGYEYYMEANDAFYLGLVLAVGSAVYGFIRPFSYDKALAKKNGTYYASSNPMDRLNIALIPDNRGIRTVQVSYALWF